MKDNVKSHKNVHTTILIFSIYAYKYYQAFHSELTETSIKEKKRKNSRITFKKKAAKRFRQNTFYGIIKKIVFKVPKKKDKAYKKLLAKIKAV